MMPSLITGRQELATPILYLQEITILSPHATIAPTTLELIKRELPMWGGGGSNYIFIVLSQYMLHKIKRIGSLGECREFEYYNSLFASWCLLEYSITVSLICCEKFIDDEGVETLESEFQV